MKSKKSINPCVIPGSKIIKMPKKVYFGETVDEAIEREAEEDKVTK